MLTVKVPYPFITQGLVPVHIYDAALVQTNGCFTPPAQFLAAGGVQIAMSDWVNGTMNSAVVCQMVTGPDASATFPEGAGDCTLDVAITQAMLEATTSGQDYVNVGLNYGLKGAGVDANPVDGAADRYDRGPTASAFGTYDALVNTPDPPTGATAIADDRDYTFSHVDQSDGAFADTVQNLNVFKRIAGVFGRVAASSIEGGTPRVTVQLVDGAGQVVADGFTDADGYHVLNYRHTGPAAWYTVIVADTIHVPIWLAANGWAEVNYDSTTGTATVEVGPSKSEGTSDSRRAR